MIRKLFLLSLFGVLLAGVYACGGGATEEADAEAPLEVPPAVLQAEQREAMGQPLTGSQRRKLEDAREGLAE